MMQNFELLVNGARRSVNADEDTPLLDVLRNTLDLKGTRFGCGHEQCGACMVLIEGEPVYSCARPVSTVLGKAITTVEGLGTAEAPHALQEAFLAEQAGQCGYCLSGILISAKGLLDRNPAPKRSEIAVALDRNLCRCGAHHRIIRAVQRAAATLAKGR
jgi:nicotinate dehydrogenase subunit A